MTEKTPSKTCLKLTQGKLRINEVALRANRSKQVLNTMANSYPEQFRLICLGALYELQQMEQHNEK